jgi:hypothetical protein
MRIFPVAGIILLMMAIPRCGISQIPVSESVVASAAVEVIEELPDPVSGEGQVAFTIETFSGENPKRISRLAHRVELWLGDRRLAALNAGDPEVVEEKNRRLFVFPAIKLPHGYYFITARCHGSAFLFGRDKWHGETFQVGIHPDATSRVYRKISFFHW